jgi:hypothetical protein
VLQKLLQRCSCIIILACCDVCSSDFTPYFVLRVSLVSRHNLFEVLNCIRVSLLRTRYAPKLIAGIDLLRINLDRTFKSFTSRVKLTSTLMDETQIVVS